MKGKLIKSNSVLLFMHFSIYLYVVAPFSFLLKPMAVGFKHREINTKRKIQGPVPPHYYISALFFCLLLLLQIDWPCYRPPPPPHTVI